MHEVYPYYSGLAKSIPFLTMKPERGKLGTSEIWPKEKPWNANGMAERTKHIISSFDDALYGLKNDVLMMSSLTDRIFQTAIEGLFNRDSELCDHVVAGDEDVDILERKWHFGSVNLT
jgi:hypothetical protein